MPREDWRRSRSFAWMAALVHFDKLVQIPIVVAHEMFGLSYRYITDAFMQCDAARYPLLAEIRIFFDGFAREIQEGGPEYVYSKEWLGIYWPADEYIFIKLTDAGRLRQFHNECGALLRALVGGTAADTSLLDEALKLNHALIKQPGVREDIVVSCSRDLLAFYRSVLVGEPI